MNRKIGMYGSVINVCAVLSFAFCMLIGNDLGSYLVCMFIAFSFVPMICTFAFYGSPEKRVAGNTAAVFAGMYAVFILLVYFAQVTTVRLDPLSEQAVQILSYPKFGLFFSYDLLGYGLMAVSTFFTGLVVEVKTKRDKWLKRLLLIHGIFAIVCFILPTTGLFRADMEGAQWIGTAVLVFWCIYFTPVGILSFFHFKNKEQQ